jgi:hypothetical protein
MEKHFYTPDFTHPLEEPGATFEADSFGGRHPVTRQARVRESARPCPPDTTSSFDDTFTLHRARLREGLHGDSRFERGVPTNDKTSSKNYPDNKVRIIDGEHKTLMTVGKINEAMEDDPHPDHILQHRLELSNPNLSEVQRGALLEHIADHSKKYRKKLKAVAEATGKTFKQGFGMLSRALPATQYDVIPQDSKVDLERKRTAGNMSMESGSGGSFDGKMRRFEAATQRAYGRRGL